MTGPFDSKRYSTSFGSEKRGRKGVHKDVVRIMNLFYLYKSMRKVTERKLDSQKEIECLMTLVNVEFDDSNKKHWR